MDLTLLGGMSRADAEAKAVVEVAKELKLKSLPKLPDATSTLPSNHHVDADAAKDGAWVRAKLLEPLNVEITGIYEEGDLAGMSDDDLRAFCEKSGIA
jgi:hypothetical protein